MVNLEGRVALITGGARGMGRATRLFAQPAADGALPTLYAATAADVHGGDYFGPDGRG